ncbi:hypothetical protein HMPREF1987_01824 [Peptostreptococcaceae bacterium oral taxon 113 str. W5053]|nr:hypothetical protein HMPREF1987_01824 [Peptostreptococcaceae bacterium oral taxon 113 str. W5053]
MKKIKKNPIFTKITWMKKIKINKTDTDLKKDFLAIKNSIPKLRERAAIYAPLKGTKNKNELTIINNNTVMG